MKDEEVLEVKCKMQWRIQGAILEEAIQKVLEFNISFFSLHPASNLDYPLSNSINSQDTQLVDNFPGIVNNHHNTIQFFVTEGEEAVFKSN